ncbi:MAG TPA: hypothetical protein VFM18_14255 [Methanosarcina sp.]|nr:hypothetical protein [Methanosarcina sp.]
MSLLDCEKCWDVYCTCGHKWKSFSNKYRLEIAKAVLPEGFAIVSTTYEHSSTEPTDKCTDPNPPVNRTK